MKLNLLDQIFKDDVVIDCGAYTGKITNYFADLGAIVHAIEPITCLADILRYKFKEFNNVHIIEKAIGYSDNNDSNKKKRLYIPKSYWSVDYFKKVKHLEGSSIYSEKINVGKSYLLVDSLNLSEFIIQLDSRVKLLKLNIEGAEYNVIRDLIDTKAIDKCDNIIVAFHNKGIPSLDKIHRSLKSEVIKKGYYGNPILWKWWNNNRNVINNIKKRYS